MSKKEQLEKCHPSIRGFLIWCEDNNYQSSKVDNILLYRKLKQDECLA